MSSTLISVAELLLFVATPLIAQPRFIVGENIYPARWTPRRAFEQLTFKIWIQLRPNAATTAPPPPLALLDDQLAELAFRASQRAAWVKNNKYTDCQNHWHRLEGVKIGFIFPENPVNAGGKFRQAEDNASLASLVSFEGDEVFRNTHSNKSKCNV